MTVEYGNEEIWNARQTVVEGVVGVAIHSEAECVLHVNQLRELVRAHCQHELLRIAFDATSSLTMTDSLQPRARRASSLNSPKRL